MASKSKFDVGGGFADKTLFCFPKDVTVRARLFDENADTSPLNSIKKPISRIACSSIVDALRSKSYDLLILMCSLLVGEYCPGLSPHIALFHQAIRRWTVSDGQNLTRRNWTVPSVFLFGSVAL